jgi:hypothetical protein
MGGVSGQPSALSKKHNERPLNAESETPYPEIYDFWMVIHYFSGGST